MLFLKRFSSNLWVIIGDFAVKKNAKLRKEICILLKID